ncbi:uncharacterized protein E0L32_004739 [Thyridium curvatum]|uniref:Uncharacterized protein n=1 Tax=Thyridium curvatum TaxID=1093900 RepID=A0A507BE06_9PEZI|nr:uncharacterized protein E0L32_004739 [Thyridium curvatum]TPX15181.1 hypothetical protein E0L32_004739 [Thyridium curvatum]
MRSHTALRAALTRQPARILLPVRSALGTSQRRLASSGPKQTASSSSSKPTSNYAAFYRTFTRPLAKTMLLAVFTYQLVYWAWVKLETDEIKAEKTAEIAGLEAQVKSLQENQKSK